MSAGTSMTADRNGWLVQPTSNNCFSALSRLSLIAPRAAASSPRLERRSSGARSTRSSTIRPMASISGWPISEMAP